ncbi:MAG: response regulator, partial [Candidatus Hydrogenedentes bacterium]|nr:response regulator [Candidatus Hydrogenedentota bacterium]
MAAASRGARILLVDDSPSTLEVLQRNLVAEGYQVLTASGVANAVAMLDTTHVDLVITDLKMPKVSGMDLVRHVRENLPDTEVMMITGYPSIEGAVQAIKTGAEEYLSKPFTDEELSSAVQRALGKLRSQRRAASPDTQLPSMPHGLLGESVPMRKALRAIGKAA